MKNSQLRKNLNYSWKVRLRIWKFRRKLKLLGKGAYIDKNVELQRYPKNISVEDNVVIKEGARICACNERATIQIGENTTVGFHTFMFASEGIEIGSDCLIAPFVYIVDSDHEIKKDILINEQPNITAKIKIGNDVWLGTGCKILKGVTIHDGAVIAAGAIVNSDVGANEIFGGIPAKKIGERK
ncbi:MAG: acyltransferase [bacterium]|nr:acyltransferase [bacterium]